LGEPKFSFYLRGVEIKYWDNQIIIVEMGKFWGTVGAYIYFLSKIIILLLGQGRLLEMLKISVNVVDTGFEPEWVIDNIPPSCLESREAPLWITINIHTKLTYPQWSNTKIYKVPYHGFGSLLF